jgi:hypothetical protein
VGTSSDLKINLKKATATNHGPDFGWQPSFAGQAIFDGWQFTTSNWHIDGQTGGGPGAWNSGFGFKVQKITAFSNNASTLCSLEGNVGNIILERIHFNSDRVGLVYGIKAVTGSYANITVSRCAFTELFGSPIQLASWSDSLVESSYFVANKSTPDFPSAAVSSSGTNVNCVWRWNIFDKIEGAAVFSGQNKGLCDNWQIYGNIISRSPTPIHFVWEPSPSLNQNEMRNSKIINNTVALGGPSSIGNWMIDSGANNLALNNLFYRCDANWFGTPVKHDYTMAIGNIRSADGPFQKDDQIVEGEPNGRIGQEPAFLTVFTDPVVSDLRAKTPGGMNTASLLPENSRDMYGRTRGAEGIWERGALEWLPGVNPPTNLRPL